MSYLLTIAILGLLIFIHELGHLVAAWWAGISVARFSIGFGPVLRVWRIRNVDYCLSAIPLGGYVLPRVEDEAEFMRIPTLRRIVFWLGGPVANFISAAMLLAIINGLADGFSLFGSLVEPWLETLRLSTQLVAALPGIFAHPSQLSGIVGIVAIGKSVVSGGLVSTLRFAVLLNLNLGVFNLLPMAPLDGGKICCSLLDKIHPRLGRLHPTLSIAGLAVLALLMVYTTVLDVIRQLA